MQDTSHKSLLWAIIIIGIIIILLLIRPTTIAPGYSYRAGSALTASTLPIDFTTARSNVGSYTIIRYIPEHYRSTSYYPTTTSPQSTHYYQQQYSGETMFSDGCTLTSPYSLTTGEPCS